MKCEVIPIEGYWTIRIKQYRNAVSTRIYYGSIHIAYLIGMSREDFGIFMCEQGAQYIEVHPPTFSMPSKIFAFSDQSLAQNALDKIQTYLVLEELTK
jgi:hypothetical protein